MDTRYRLTSCTSSTLVPLKDPLEQILLLDHVIPCRVRGCHHAICETLAKAINVDLDLDGDSHMHSSSSDEADSDAMFPAEHDPPGSAPQHQNSVLPDAPHGYQQALPEVATSTPPQSQDNEQAMDMETGNDRVSENGPTHAALRESGIGQKNPDLVTEPGAAWNTKKAMEEYRRALTQIEDRNFSLSE